MFVTIAVILRIISNSLSNVFQKQLAEQGFNPSYINFIMYLGLSVCIIPLIAGMNYMELSNGFYLYAVLGGLFGALGNSYLVKALKNGELSVLGPINAYKSVVAMIFGIFLLGEIPSLYGIVAVLLIIAGRYFVFDTQEEGFSFKLLSRADIRYRFYALFFTALEAVCIKNVIKESDIVMAFIMWCVFGAIFTGIIIAFKEVKTPKITKTAFFKFVKIIILMGLMQYTTNYVFSNMQVSYGLALFQMSALVSVILGWRYFNETNIVKKLLGTLIMVTGAVILSII